MGLNTSAPTSPRALSPPPSYFLKAVTARLSDLLCFYVLVMETNSCISLHWAPALFADRGEIISTRIFLHSSGKGWWIKCALYAFVISWTFLQLDTAVVSHPPYMHIYLHKWRSVGQTWLVSPWQKSRPGTDRVHRWFTASYEYADMNIQEGTVNPEGQGRGNIQHLFRQPKTGTITLNICSEC